MYYSKKRKIKKNNTGRYKNKPLLSEDNDDEKKMFVKFHFN